MTRMPALRARSLAAALSLGVASGLLWTSSGTAVARTDADPATACPFTRTLCLFDANDYEGARFTAQSLNPPAAVCVNLAEHGWGNRAKSAVNTASESAVLYTNTDCTGRSLAVSGNVPSLTFAAQSVRVH